ncbi:NAD(P)/FAD-dependent oxidoreductase [soil metagenome]
MSSSIFAQVARRADPAAFLASRRDVLKASLAAGAGLMLSGLVPGAAAAQPGKNGRRVIVIGAGFAGLACAYELAGLGYDVTVLEARGRLGGRVLSFNDYAPGTIVEGGAEFIGSNHPAWLAYAKKFNLEMLEVPEWAELSSPLLVDGKLLGVEEANALHEALEKTLRRLNLNALVTNAEKPWETPRAAEWDARTMQQWLDELDAPEDVKRVVKVQLEADNGQALGQMSYLGQLAQIKGGGCEQYWLHSEDYRCRGGNQQLALRLADALGAGRIHTGAPVARIDMNGNRGRVAVMTKDNQRYEADDVVLAIPPSVWDKIAFANVDFEREVAGLRMQMGRNIKFFAAIGKTFWMDDKASPYGLAEGPINLTWNAADAQEVSGAVLAGFAGGPSADVIRNLPADQQIPAGLSALQRLYPKLAAETVNPRFMNWPADPWVLASYSFPRPGQLTTIAPLLHQGLRGGFDEPRLHFAGEHMCHAFVGYMEGALQSGIAAARTLAKRDGLKLPSIPVIPIAPAPTPANPPAPPETKPEKESSKNAPPAPTGDPAAPVKAPVGEPAKTPTPSGPLTPTGTPRKMQPSGG